MSGGFHSLEVIGKDFPIKEASTIRMAIPPELKSVFRFSPGQHLPFRFFLAGEELRRTYSIVNSPDKEYLEVTVKRVKGGRISNHINDNLQVGHKVEVMPPQGRFFIRTASDNYKSYFLFGAGSGITPLYSMLQTILRDEPYSNVTLLYGNRDKSQILFLKQLEALVEEHGKRLKVIHSLSEPRSTWSMSWTWKYRTGMIDNHAVTWFIHNHPPVSQQTGYYICGPGGMNKSVAETLLELGVPKEMIHFESFGGGGEVTLDFEPVADAQLEAVMGRNPVQVSIPKGWTVLRALKEAGNPPPYSCESGVCGSCVGKVVAGKAKMKNCMALEESEVEAGYVLACQSLPASPSLKIEFESA